MKLPRLACLLLALCASVALAGTLVTPVRPRTLPKNLTMTATNVWYSGYHNGVRAMELLRFASCSSNAATCLFAGTGSLEDPWVTPSNSFVLVTTNGWSWIVDKVMPTNQPRVTSMVTCSFGGTQLVVVGCQTTNTIATEDLGFWTRTTNGVWTYDVVSQANGNLEFRAACCWTDSVTGVEMALVAIESMLFRGTYDESSASKIAWSGSLDKEQTTGERALAFAVANGSLYCSQSTSIWKRTDGVSPSWTKVYDDPRESYAVGLREFTGMPHPWVSGRDVLVFQSAGDLYMLFPDEGHRCDRLDDAKRTYEQQLGGTLTTYRSVKYGLEKFNGANLTYWFSSTVLIWDTPPAGEVLLGNASVRLRVPVISRIDDHWYRQVILMEPQGEAPAVATNMCVRSMCPSPFAGETGVYFIGCPTAFASHEASWMARIYRVVFSE